ncbi:MAG: protein-glutamate O-methyltransferase CheR [Defluviitaleaceae bacterium]|nr:protein-glutamate O-methyltransferase CheR [Defluviitaleaceae bacterium]
MVAIELKDSEFLEIREHMKRHFGISMGDEKRTLVFSRLRPLLREKGFQNFTQLIDFIKADKTGEATVALTNRLTTNHTFFMREAEHFDYLRERVFPWIERTFGHEKDLRLWCAASSSGEEAYTLQMLASDYFEGKPGWNLEILATDISENVLAQASHGIYSNESLSTLPKDWLKKYFNKYDGSNMIVKDEVKQRITFRKFNLMETKMPFKRKFQVIFCRNVMIYFDADTRAAICDRLGKALEKDGYLFLGHSESISNMNLGFKYMQPAVYQVV